MNAQGWILHGVARGDCGHATALGASRLDLGFATALLSALRLDGTAEEARREALRHHAILEASARAADVVPARFGRAFAAPAEAAAHVIDHRPVWEAALARIAGCVEFACDLEVPQSPAPPVPDAPGYLRRRLHERTAGRDGRRMHQAILDLLAPVVVQAQTARQIDPVPGSSWLALGLLVARSRVPELRGDLAAALLPAGIAADGIRLRGPWPAYSFATGTENGEGEVRHA